MIPLPSCLSLYPSAEQLHQSKATQRSLHVSANQFGGKEELKGGWQLVRAIKIHLLRNLSL